MSRRGSRVGNALSTIGGRHFRDTIPREVDTLDQLSLVRELRPSYGEVFSLTLEGAGCAGVTFSSTSTV